MTDSNTIEHENETPKEASADRAGDLQNEEAAQNAAEERAQVGENPRDKAGSHAEKIVTKSAFLQMGFVVLGLLCVMLVVLNLVFSNVTTARWDLTTDKQFTLSPATVELLSSLDAKIAVKFFLSPNCRRPIMVCINAQKICFRNSRRRRMASLALKSSSHNRRPTKKSPRDLGSGKLPFRNATKASVLCASYSKA